jgi:hypothetical protein
MNQSFPNLTMEKHCLYFRAFNTGVSSLLKYWT